MPDREKVIKGLVHCGFNEKRGCVGCPYSDECGDFGRDAGMSSLATDALALLREQEPMELHVEHDSDDDSWYYGCGACHEAIDYKDRFCRHCGREVKWDG